MKNINTRNFVARFMLLLSVFITIQITVVAQDVSASYDECTGVVTLQARVKHHRAAKADDYISWYDIYYVNSNGTERKIFFWKQNNNGPLTTSFEGKTFSYGREWSTTVDGELTFDLQTVSNGPGTDIILNVGFKGADFNDWGNTLDFRFQGRYERPGPDSDWNFNTSRKTAIANGVDNNSFPTNLTSMVDNCGEIKLNWTKPSINITNSGFDCGDTKSSADIHFKKENGQWQFLTHVTFPATNYTHSGLDGDTKYEYRMRQLFQPNPFRYQYTGWSNTLTAYTVGKSNAVTNVLASNDRCDGKIEVSWDHNQSGNLAAEDYDIYRKESTQSSWSLIKSNHTTRTYIDESSSVAPDIDYDYYINVRNKCGIVTNGIVNQASGFAAGEPKNPISVTPTISTDPGNSIFLDWPPSESLSSIVNGYKIRRTAPGESEAIFTTNNSMTQYTDRSVGECISYTYEIFTTSACHPDGFGTPAVTTATIGLDLENDITLFKTSKGFFDDFVELTWDVVSLSSVNQIRIERRILGEPVFTQIKVLSVGDELYNDFTAEPGILYEYRIIGDASCNSQVVTTNSSTDVGFRTKSGTVTGKVSYTGGIAVPDVKLVAESTNGIVPVAMSFNGADAHMTIKDSVSFRSVGNGNTDFLIEAWMRPNPDAYSKDFSLFKKQGAYELIYQQSDSSLLFRIYDAANGTKEVKHSLQSFLKDNPTQVSEWRHVGAMMNNNMLYLIQDGIMTDSVDATGTVMNTASINDLHIGAQFHGLLREFRLWDTAKDSLSLRQDHSRYMLGNEANIKIYLPMTEQTGTYAYDRSRLGTNFNEHHALLSNVTRVFNDIPDKSQLGFLGYTNSSGDYILTLPYSNAGLTYVITPIYLTHSFDPSQRLVFVGDGATVNNNIDFEDISSFPVTGTAFFRGTTCPVANAFLKIDGDNVIKNGQAVITDSDGNFSIDVPIGNHFISIEKPNHTFELGRWPSDETETFDFQAPVSGIDFIDSTLITITGRVVGGTRETLKDPGLGLSKNNIGVAQLTFVSQQGGGCVDTSIMTGETTGEYTIKLPPLTYIPDISVQNNPLIENYFDMPANVPALIDVSNPGIILSTTVTDTTTTPNTNFNFDKKVDYVYRVDPMIDVTDPNGQDPFIGDSIYVYPSSNGNDTLNLRQNPLPYPVFAGRNISRSDSTYTAALRIFEEYKNFDADPINPVRDSVPTVDGMLSINNLLSEAPIQTLDMDQLNAVKLDTLQYKFRLGQGNLTENAAIPEYSYTRTMQIDLVKPNGDVVSWQPITGSIPTGGDRIYRAYVLTPKHDGERFVTKGPQKVDYIVRDPPGTASSASREVGKGSTNSRAWSWGLGGEVSVSDVIYSGTKFVAGTGIAIETDVESTTNFGYSIKLSGGRNGKFSETISNTEKWATNGIDLAILNPDDEGDLTPGADGDVFIGAAQNLQFGIAEEIAFVPISNCAQMDCEGGLLDSAGNPTNFRAARTYSLAMQPDGYETGFVYTQKHIKLVLIPDLIELRNTIILGNAKYTTNVPQTDSLFGSNNDDPRWANRTQNEMSCSQSEGFGSVSFRTLSGCSYTYNAINEQDSLTGDSVRIINNQIHLWEEALRLNEWEKVNISKQSVIDSLKNRELSKLEVEFKDALDANIGAIAGGVGAGFFNGATIGIGALLTGGSSSAVFGYTTFAVVSGASIAGAEISAQLNEYEIRKARIEEKFASLQPENRSISSGVEYTNSISQTRATSETGKFEYSLSADLKNKVKGKINNNGVEVQRGISLNFNSGREWTSEESETDKVSYTLIDGDVGDFFSVDVYPSMLGYGPIFKRKAGGQTSCPYEPEIKTQFYLPGTVISEATGQVDKPTISASPIIQTNIPSDQAAVYTLTLANEGVTDLNRPYKVEVFSASNPFGAIVKIDGFSSSDVIVGPDVSIVKTLTIEKGPGPVFEYDSLEVRIFPDCQRKLFQSVFLSAHFIPNCSDVSIVNPENQWVLNTNFNDTMPVDLIDYNINTEDLERIRIDYKPSEESQWIGLQSFWKDTTGMNDPLAVPIPTGAPFTHYDWNVGSLPDGAYDLRAVAICTNAENSSPVHSGYMDRITPHAFGSPSPADGILDPDDDIIIKMNEPVDIGSITTLNFDVRGVLNGAPLRHETSMAFDGVNDYASIPEYQLQKRSLSIEFWVKRNGTGEEAIVSQGANNDQLYIGFNTANQLICTLGDQSITSDFSITNSDWYHIAFSYDRSSTTAAIFIANANQAIANPNVITNNFVSNYNSTGPILVGKDNLGNKGDFDGFMHALRLWSIPRSEGNIAAQRNIVLNGREAGLIGNWPMDEGYGTVAYEKVRSRHAQMQTNSWSILPQNHAFQFSAGMTDTLSAKNAAVLVFSKEADLTLEAWFKTGASSTQSIMSNGKGDTINRTGWDVSLTASGQIKVANNDKTLETPANIAYNDNNWHHISIVVQRSGAVTIYVDGQPVTVGNASDFEGFAGPKLWIGMRGFPIGATDSIDQRMIGFIDEVRIWNTARTSEQIARDFTNQMSGDELGLVAFYPFDGVTELAGVFIRTETLEDLSTNAFDLSFSGVNPNFSIEAPPVKLPRLVQNVNFNYSLNNDEIFIQMTDPPAWIENVTIDITVSGLKDIAGNTMESPETWIAYVNQNQVFWETEYIELSKEFEEALSFSAVLKNTGGSQEQYTITNLPAWLSASTTSGTIDPNSQLTVNFTIDPSVNIGQYEQDIFVSTASFGFNERLLLDLTVFEPAPLWSIDENSFDHSMNIVGELHINGVVSSDVNDVVSVWINDELRGVANIELDETSNKYLVFLTVVSNTTGASSLEFKAWDASAGQILTELSPLDKTFSNNSILGTRGSPQIIEASAQIELNYFLDEGWNWLSFPLQTSDLNDINSILSELSPTENDELKYLSQFIGYFSGSWSLGSLTQLNTDLGYKLKLSKPDTFSYSGTFIDPSSDPIEVVEGWNWIGVKSLTNIDLQTALSSLDPQTGDLIKGQYSFAIYEEGFGWGGSLTVLEPLESYMLKYNKTDDLIFPNIQNNLRPSPPDSRLAIEEFEDVFDYQVGAYSNNMSLTASIDECITTASGGSLDLEEWFLVAFANGTYRGAAEASYVPSLSSYRYYLTIDGNSAFDIEFKLIHRSNFEEIVLNQGVSYQSNAILGSMANPYEFNCSSDEPCPDDLLINSFDGSSFEFSAKHTVEVQAVVPAGQEFIFKSGQSVSFDAPFEVTEGTVIHVLIEVCQEDQNR